MDQIYEAELQKLIDAGCYKTPPRQGSPINRVMFHPHHLVQHTGKHRRRHVWNAVKGEGSRQYPLWQIYLLPVCGCSSLPSTQRGLITSGLISWRLEDTMRNTGAWSLSASLRGAYIWTCSTAWMPKAPTYWQSGHGWWCGHDCRPAATTCSLAHRKSS